jgi:hypothetical protein
MKSTPGPDRIAMSHAELYHLMMTLGLADKPDAISFTMRRDAAPDDILTLHISMELGPASLVWEALDRMTEPRG